MAELAARLAAVDEQCFFLKDALYSVLSSAGGPPKVPPPMGSKLQKGLRPLKTPTAPWNTSVMPPGL